MLSLRLVLTIGDNNISKLLCHKTGSTTKWESEQVLPLFFPLSVLVKKKLAVLLCVFYVTRNLFALLFLIVLSF